MEFKAMGSKASFLRRHEKYLYFLEEKSIITKGELSSKLPLRLNGQERQPYKEE